MSKKVRRDGRVALIHQSLQVMVEWVDNSVNSAVHNVVKPPDEQAHTQLPPLTVYLYKKGGNI